MVILSSTHSNSQATLVCGEPVPDGPAGSVCREVAPGASCQGSFTRRPEAEIGRSYLSQLDKGAFYASLKIIGKLAAVLQIEPAELLQMPTRKSTRRK
jgi:hypothetical protein